MTNPQQQNIGGACGGAGGYDVFGSRKITTDNMDYASGSVLWEIPWSHWTTPI